MKKLIYLTLIVVTSFTIFVTSCKKDDDDTTPLPTVDLYAIPVSHATGVPALSGMLDPSKFTMSSIIQVDLDKNIARVPLFKGTYQGNAVWYVLMDVSDKTLATQLGLNFAPRLIKADNGCASCIQTVTSANTTLGAAPVEFVGTVDFSPVRSLVPSTTGFPPLSATPGSIAVGGYSDLVRVQGSTVVYNAPIIATGNGPFDVSEMHTNTLDRVTAIDTVAMTVDMQFIRAFSHGKDVFYFTFGSTGALSATLERGTFVPGMASIPFANDDRDPNGARSSIFAPTNGKIGLNMPESQGLSHVLLDNAPGNISLQNPALLETLRKLGDSHNVLGSFPTLTNQTERELYSPLWDLNLAVWSDAVVAAGRNFAQTDANTIRQHAARGLITNPGGGMLGSANFIVNCSVLGFATTAPTQDQAPRP
ncbi:MAG: hypothetical protein M3Q95_12200 [Bacteroidota bacterium]|nr:hypothetical protein [Bacteroidota bacterium]